MSELLQSQYSFFVDGRKKVMGNLLYDRYSVPIRTEKNPWIEFIVNRAVDLTVNSRSFS